MLNSLVALYDSGVPVSTNSYESIQTYNIGSGGSSSVTFSSIPQTYSHLQIRAIGRSTAPSTGIEALMARFNSDSGNNYARHALVGNGSSASAVGYTGISFSIIGILPHDGDLANVFNPSVADILDYSNANKYKTVRTLTGMDTNGSTAEISLHSGLWLNTAAITSITVSSSANNIAQYSSIALYGIKA